MYWYRPYHIHTDCRVTWLQVAVLKDLMADWKGHVGADGKTFYHNSTSKESVWVLPDNVRQQV